MRVIELEVDLHAGFLHAIQVGDFGDQLVQRESA